MNSFFNLHSGLMKLGQGMLFPKFIIFRAGNDIPQIPKIVIPKEILFL